MKVEFKAKAFLDTTYNNLKDVLNGNSMPHITQNGSYFESQGYPMIGEVTVIINVMPADKIVASQVDALRKQLHLVRAENQRRENAILDQISKLEALPCEVDA